MLQAMMQIDAKSTVDGKAQILFNAAMPFRKIRTPMKGVFRRLIAPFAPIALIGDITVELVQQAQSNVKDLPMRRHSF
jgi:hypothetical protein